MWNNHDMISVLLHVLVEAKAHSVLTSLQIHCKAVYIYFFRYFIGWQLLWWELRLADVAVSYVRPAVVDVISFILLLWLLSIVVVFLAPTSSPIIDEVRSDGSDRLHVRWSPPHKDGQNGQIIEYVVRWTPVHESSSTFDDGDDESVSDRTRSSTNAGGGTKTQASTIGTQMRIDGLRSYTLYRVTVAAATHQGIGPESAPVEGRTAEDGLFRLLVCMKNVPHDQWSVSIRHTSWSIAILESAHREAQGNISVSLVNRFVVW